jgi:hypothetical protein
MATFAACSPFTVFGTPKEAPCARHGRFLTPSAPSPPHGLRTKSETAPIHHQDISLCGDPSGTAFSRSYESSLGIVCRCFQATPDTQNSEFMMEWRLENGAGMNSDLKMARQRELTLVDSGWIFGAVVVLLLMCLCILFFVKGANVLTSTQTELLLRTPDPIPIVQASPEASWARYRVTNTPLFL